MGSSILRADLPELASLLVALEAAGYSCTFNEAVPEQPRSRQAHRADVTAEGAYELPFTFATRRRPTTLLRPPATSTTTLQQQHDNYNDNRHHLQ